MTGPTKEVFDPQTGGAGANGDTVVASANAGARNGDGRRFLDVDPVRVRAVSRGGYSEIHEVGIVAAIDEDVKHLAV